MELHLIWDLASAGIAAIFLLFSFAFLTIAGSKRYEKRGLFYAGGLIAILMGRMTEILGDLYANSSWLLLEHGLYALAGISFSLSCYLSVKFLDTCCPKEES
ncbi:MAG: hypothetical protein V3T58_06810 [Candidatus Hydrothermarchaeales archaeon]